MKKSPPLFSVVVIAKNEAKTLPKLVYSLLEFRDRGGEIVVLDTGSTDGTCLVAKGLGCVVYKSSDHQRRVGITRAAEINSKFVAFGESNIVQGIDEFFDFSAARNLAAGWATNKFVFMPDCDEVVTKLDLDKINEAIQSGEVDQFEYEFVFSHAADGATPQIQFRHCKFYNYDWLRWTGIVHEILSPTDKAKLAPRRRYVDYIQLEHHQNRETSRSQYLVGLAVDCYNNPANDRNSHYFARELMWSGRFESAKKEFRRHIAMPNGWIAEQAQSQIFLGDIYRQQHGNMSAAIDEYFHAWRMDGNRREALIKIAECYYQDNKPQQTASFAEAALAVPLHDYYGNQLHHYREYPHELLYWAYWQLGDKVRSELHWSLAIDFAPTHPKYLHDAQFYETLPLVSIIIPHIEGTRENELTRLHHLIKQNANYPNYEVIVELDFLEKRQGCPKTFKRGVTRAKGDLIMYLGDDCEPQPSFLILAVRHHLEHAAKPGLTALNDGLWNGTLATHWLADKDLAAALNGGVPADFFYIGYHHVGCDNELTEKCKRAKRYTYCRHAKIVHNTPRDEVWQLAWDSERVRQDRALLCKRTASPASVRGAAG